MDFWNGFGLKVLCTAIFLLLIIASFSITKTDENYSPVQSTQEQQDSSNEYTDNNANNTPIIIRFDGHSITNVKFQNQQ